MRVGALLLTAGIGLTPTALGAQGLDDAQKEACANAYDNSQVLRDAGKLELARAQLDICQRACPRELARDCAGWKEELDSRRPSVRLAARDTAGAEVRATVRIDGGPPMPLPSDEIRLEPGEHRFVFERTSDGVTAAETITLGPGEHERRVIATFEPPSSGLASTEIAAIVLASIGGTAMVVGGAFAIRGHVDRAALFDCRPNCDQRDVDAIATTWTISGIVAGAGAAALGTALVVWLLADEDVSKDIAVGPASLSMRF